MEHSVCQIGDSKNETTHSNLPEAVYSAKTVIAVADSKLAKFGIVIETAKFNFFSHEVPFW